MRSCSLLPLPGEVCRLVSRARPEESGPAGPEMAGNCSWDTHPTTRNKASTARRLPAAGALQTGAAGGAHRAQMPPHSSVTQAPPSRLGVAGSSRAPGGCMVWHQLAGPWAPQCPSRWTPSNPVLCGAQGLRLPALRASFHVFPVGWGGQLSPTARLWQEALRGQLQGDLVSPCSGPPQGGGPLAAVYLGSPGSS